MKEVMAFVRPERWVATRSALVRAGFPALTGRRVLGRGRSRGLRYLPRQGGESGLAIGWLPKRMLTLVVEDARVPAAVEALLGVNRTGQPGDGRIFVLPVEDAIRLRTGERGGAALGVAPLGGSVGAPEGDA